MTKTKNIDGIEFTATQFPALEAVRLKAYLLGKFGPALAELLGMFANGITGKGSIADMNLDSKLLADAVEKLMANLSEEEFVALLKRLFRLVTAKGSRDGKPFVCAFTSDDDASFEASFELAFKDRTFSIYPVILLVLEANYPDFFGKAVRNIGNRLTKIVSSAPGSENETSAQESLGT
jgi:hypothetical protein